MKMIQKCFILLFIIAVCAACQRKPASTADVPRLISPAHKISVAPFTQPLNPSQLISGQIPEFQGRISHESLLSLDKRLKSILSSQTKRQFAFLPADKLPANWEIAKSTGQPSGLEDWLAYGREMKADYMLVPQVLDWHEREGSEAGVTSSASCKLDFYLLDVPRSIVVARSIFEEKQVGLIDNLFTVGEFVKRKGQWVTAEAIASEGMEQAIRDMGL